MQERTVSRIVALSTLAGVLVVSFLPSGTVDPIRPNIGDTGDVGHVLAYALLAGTTMLSVPRQWLTPWRGICIVFAISLFGIAIEMLQPLAGRTTSLIDFAQNEAGIACGVAIFCGYVVARKFANKGGGSRSDGA